MVAFPFFLKTEMSNQSKEIKTSKIFTKHIAMKISSHEVMIYMKVLISETGKKFRKTAPKICFQVCLVVDLGRTLNLF